MAEWGTACNFFMYNIKLATHTNYCASKCATYIVLSLIVAYDLGMEGGDMD